MSNQDVSTDDYIKAIQYAKDNGHTANIDFSNLPDGVDAKAVAAAAGQGLPDTHTSALNDAATNGHHASLDFSLLGAVAKNAAQTAMTGPMDATVATMKDPIGVARSPIGQAALPILGGVAGAEVGLPGVGAALGEAATQGIDKVIMPDLAPTDKWDAVQKVATQAVAPEAIETGINAAKTAYPYFANMFTKVPMKFAQTLLENPAIIKQFPGTVEAVKSATAKIPEALNSLHEAMTSKYGAKLAELGIADGKDANEIAEDLLNKNTVASAKPLSAIGHDLLDFKTSSGMSDVEKLKRLDRIDSDINAHLNYLKSGQTVGPVDSTITPKLMVIKNAVADELKNIPGGSALKSLKEEYGTAARLYETLAPNFKDAGTAEKTLRNWMNDESGASDTPLANLKQLDQLVGQPVAETAQNHLMSQALTKKLAPSMIGKMSALMTLIHPFRAYQLPIVGAAQSPYLQTQGIRALMALQAGAHAAPEMISPMVNGLQQGTQALGGALEKNKELTEDDLFTK